jgi:hypothetical protein
VIVIGIIGIYEYYHKKVVAGDEVVKPRLVKTFKICLWISLILNIIAIIPTTIHYSKRARVEAMVYLSNYPESEYYIIEGMLSNGVRMPVEAYADHLFKGHYEVHKNRSWEKEAAKFDGKPVAFVLFEGEENMDVRLDEARKYYPNLVYATECRESFLDALVQAINPINENYPIIIYRNADVIKE